MKEMPVKSAGRILNENDKRLWRVLNAYVEEAHQSVDLSDLTQVGSDELSYRKRHKYVTVFADMEQKRVVYAVKGKTSLHGNASAKTCRDAMAIRMRSPMLL